MYSGSADFRQSDFTAEQGWTLRPANFGRTTELLIAIVSVGLKDW